MKTIDSRDAKVHYLFEGLLAGELQTISDEQRVILLDAMVRAYPGLKARAKAHAKTIVVRESPRSFHQDGRRGKPQNTEYRSLRDRIITRIKHVCVLLIVALSVVFGWSLYVQYLQ